MNYSYDRRTEVARYRVASREVRILVDRDATNTVREKHHKAAIVGTFDSSAALYRIFDGEELVRLSKTGKFTGGTFSVSAERAHGASWGEDISAIIRWGNNIRGQRLGDDLFLAKIDVLDKRFYHLDPNVEFDPNGDKEQNATMDLARCGLGLGCSVVDVAFNDATFYRVDPSGQIEPLSDAEIKAYVANRPRKDVEFRKVSPVYYTGTIYGIDVDVIYDQVTPREQERPTGPYYHTWYVEVTRVPHAAAMLLRGAKTAEVAIQKAKGLLKGTDPEDWFRGHVPVDLLPKATLNQWRKREEQWQKMQRFT